MIGFIYLSIVGVDCRFLGISMLLLPLLSDECSRNVPAAKEKLDLVFGFALSSRSTSSVDSKNIVSNFIGDLNIEDMRIGLVHGDDQSARANFIEGK